VPADDIIFLVAVIVLVVFLLLVRDNLAVVLIGVVFEFLGPLDLIVMKAAIAELLPLRVVQM
jgi:hypothetical protein